MTSDFPPFLEIADRLSDAVSAADFPQHILRHRNDRAAAAIGLGGLSEAQWEAHFARFEPFQDNIPQPLAMRYHGHQFGAYNPDIGDGRGFLFAQFRDERDRWLDLGTKGSGRTPYSRTGDGRLTLKGGVREVLASAMLDALGVNVSKAFSLYETGEQLMRGDEPSPTRSSVLVRMSHSHIRIGSFQRLAALELAEDLVALVEHSARHYFPHALHEGDAPRTAAALLEAMTAASARMVGSWMAAGFVHGVMNTDNFNLTGETFDFGPYRFVPQSDPNFTAAYFDHQGLYRFGAQPSRGAWNMQQMAVGLMSVPGITTDALQGALDAYEPTFQEGIIHALFGRLGIARGARDEDLKFAEALFGWMTESGIGWEAVFFDWFGGAPSERRAMQGPNRAYYDQAGFAPVREVLMSRAPVQPERLEHAYFQREAPVTLLIDEIETLWSAIADRDDWSLYEKKLEDIELARVAMGLTPPKGEENADGV